MPTTEKLKQEIADAEKKLAQERSRLQRLENRKSYYEKGDENPIMRRETGRNGRTASLPEGLPWRALHRWRKFWAKRSSMLLRKRFLLYRKSGLY